MYNSPIFYFREKGKVEMSAASKCNEIISGITTPRAIPQRNQLSLTKKLLQLKRNRCKLSATVGNNSARYTAFHTCEVTILRLINTKLSFN